MKKQAYVIIALTSFLFVLFFSHSLLEILDFDWSIFLHDVEKTEKFVFLLLVFEDELSIALKTTFLGKTSERCLGNMKFLSNLLRG